MRRIFALIPLLAVLLCLPLGTAYAGKKGKKNKAGRNAVLPPVSHERAANLKPVTTGRAAGLKPVTIDRAAKVASISNGRAATLKGVTTGRAAGLKPVTVDRAAGLAPVSADRAATLAPVTVDRAAGLAPVTIDRAAELAPISDGRVAGLAPVTTDRAVTGLTELATGELPAVSLDRAGLMPVTTARNSLLSSVVTKSNDLPVIAWNDGYMLPYQARRLVRDGWINRDALATLHTRAGYETYHRSLTRTFHRYGWGRSRLIVGGGSGYYGLNRIDTCGPQWYHRSYYGGGIWGRGRDCLPGRRVGDFYFPIAYYYRPYGWNYRWGARRYNKTYWPILVPWDCAEAIPADFERTLQKSHFPMVIGDMAFKKGNYVQAAIAFRDALDRKSELVAGRFAFGDALIALRNYTYAVGAIQGGLDAAPKWSDKLDRHGVYGVKGDLEKHLKEIEKFTVDYPKTHSGWFLLGYVRMTSGDVGLREKAVKAFEKALEIRPTDTYTQRFLDLIRGETREIQHSVEDAEKGEPVLVKESDEKSGSVAAAK